MQPNETMSKKFIITVDTEGDNLWNWRAGDSVSTENSRYIPRFQELCDKYGFKPVYLTNYEMACCDRFMDRAVEWQNNGACEIGVHLHAWNNPPSYPLRKTYEGQDYLIEYPEEIMRAKFDAVYSLIKSKTGNTPPLVSHRAGRWAMNGVYFKILRDYGIKVDCSFTPGVDWSDNKGASTGGTDYSKASRTPVSIAGVLEVPMTVRRLRTWTKGSLKHKLKCLALSKHTWLRPAGHSLFEMKHVLATVAREEDTDYAEFMIHSSELMPAGSPYFRDKADIDELYRDMDALFARAVESGYEGCTLRDYERERSVVSD